MLSAALVWTSSAAMSACSSQRASSSDHAPFHSLPPIPCGFRKHIKSKPLPHTSFLTESTEYAWPSTMPSVASSSEPERVAALMRKSCESHSQSKSKSSSMPILSWPPGNAQYRSPHADFSQKNVLDVKAGQLYSSILYVGSASGSFFVTFRMPKMLSHPVMHLKARQLLPPVMLSHPPACTTQAFSNKSGQAPPSLGGRMPLTRLLPSRYIAMRSSMVISFHSWEGKSKRRIVYLPSVDNSFVTNKDSICPGNSASAEMAETSQQSPQAPCLTSQGSMSSKSFRSGMPRSPKRTRGSSVSACLVYPHVSVTSSTKLITPTAASASRSPPFPGAR
mmetsp:Transcript_133215/g.426148  ORF Transcript_133215/g.426148 Transcript_133215/m.426148 type:complete len:335 (+) Transcript_133215:673-1677(+)